MERAQRITKGSTFLMTIDDKNFSFPFVSVRFDAFGAFCLCERSLRSGKRLQTQANTREDRLAVSTPSVGTMLINRMRFPTESFGDWRRLIERRPALLIRDFQEQQKRQL